MSPDPYEAGPPEYQPDEEPGDDDRALWAEAAADYEAFLESSPFGYHPLGCQCERCSVMPDA